MRFDDMLATILARSPDRPAARIAQWRQLLDIVAQRRAAGSALDGAALARLATVRATIPVDARRDAAVAIAGRPLDDETVLLLADDVPAVVGPLFARLMRDDAEWIAILPRLSPTARGFLRHRRDLGVRVKAALESFGTTDFALPGTIAAPSVAVAVREEISDSRASDDEPELPLPETPSAHPEPHEPGAGTGQIRAIISRIARFQSDRDERPEPALPPAAPCEAFRFETGRDGVIRWVDGAPRGPLIGETIADAAAGRYGVDAQAPGAFRRRAPFRGARLTVAGDGPVAGDWRIAAVPLFAPDDGRFLGYRGTARRPHAHERTDPDRAAAGNASPAAPADTIRQLVHELRTPINAIGGFAEMIRRQLRGPVSEAYRDRAAAIAADANRLLAAVDDLDLVARLDADRLGLRRGEVDIASLLHEVAAVSEGPGVASVTVSVSGHGVRFPPVVGDAATIRRMIARLSALMLAYAGTDETVVIAADACDGDAAVSFGLPARLRGRPADALLDPVCDPADEEGEPLFGLGFSLHLVRRLADAAGGTIEIVDDAVRLRFPTVEPIRDTGRA